MSTEASLDGLRPACIDLIQGRGWDRYGDSYRVHAAILAGMITAGWSVTRAVNVLLTQDHAGCARLRATYRGSLASKTISRWSRVAGSIQRHEERCVEWCNEVITHWPFGGLYGASFRVLLALGVLAHEAGTTSFTASQMRIGEVAGVDSATCSARHASTTTVRASLARLVAWEFVIVTHDEPQSVSAALFDANTRYTLADPGRVRFLCTAFNE